MLKGKTVLLGVTGGIAAYKAAQLVSDLKKLGADIHVIMTKNATEFVTPLTFETMSGNRVSVDTFDRNFEWQVGHISLAKRGDVFVVAPATANVIAKLAYGLADDMLTTTFLAAGCPKLVAPAMNTGMLQNPITQRNIAALAEAGVGIIEPETGLLACNDVGAGKLAAPSVIIEHIISAVTEKDLPGLNILITAGPAREALDPVRFITNHSTGKMGYQMALAAARRGAKVTLVSGPTHLPDPMGVQTARVTSAAEMQAAVEQAAPGADIIIKSAAVADYRPAQTQEHKMKKSGQELTLPLARTTDILATLGRQKRPGQVLVGFSMETQNLLDNSRAKLEAKNADMIVANNLAEAGAGFGVDTNIVTILTPDGQEQLPLMSKYELGGEILTRAATLARQRSGEKPD